MPNNSFMESRCQKEIKEEFFNQSHHSDLLPRPHTLDDLIKKEKLIEDKNLLSTLTYSQLDEDEEFWIVDIPKSIDPLQLKGQTFHLGDKSNFKIEENRYCALNRDTKSNITCVFNTKNESTSYKAVNIKPAGTVSIRKKLSGISKKKIQFEKFQTVPFPKNIKLRHPLFGVQCDDFIVKNEKNAIR